MPIERRGKKYFAYLDVPKDVRTRLGRRVYRKTLKTDSRSVAERRAAVLIAHWKSEIAAAREHPDHNDRKFWQDALHLLDATENTARDNIEFWLNAQRRADADEQSSAYTPGYWRSAYQKAKTDDDREIVDAELETHVHLQGLDNTDPEARWFYGQVWSTPTTEHLDEWIKSLQVKEKTAKMRRSTIERLGKKFPTLQEVSRKAVRRWVTDLMTDLKSATIQRMMTDCRTYWAYLQTIEVVPEDNAPFDRLGLRVKRESWLPYEPKDATKILNAAQAENETLADVISIAMFTGARREEICSLKVDQVSSDHFDIIDAKTDAGIRSVPVHPKLSKTVI